jgi:SEC-C motif-containing protein
MRSRYAAFATKDVRYLWRTLHPDHDDRARPEEQVLRELREACSANRYLGLRILDARGPDADGIARVLFVAKVFRKGRDLSFVEASDFARDGEMQAWRYLRGDAQPLDAVGELDALTLDTFAR